MESFFGIILNDIWIDGFILLPFTVSAENMQFAWRVQFVKQLLLPDTIETKRIKHTPPKIPLIVLLWYW